MLASLTHSLVSLQSCPSSISQTAISPYNNNVLYRHKEARGQALTTPITRPPITTPTTAPNNYHAHQPNLLITTPLFTHGGFADSTRNASRRPFYRSRRKRRRRGSACVYFHSPFDQESYQVLEEALAD